LKFYRAKLNRLRTVDDIKSSIISNGPVLAMVDAGISFEEYTGGIMTCSGSSKNLDDVVSLVGWGVSNNTPYWIGVNSWGSAWGEKGYFQIELGVNACGIETLDYAVQYIDK